MSAWASGPVMYRSGAAVLSPQAAREASRPTPHTAASERVTMWLFMSCVFSFQDVDETI